MQANCRASCGVCDPNGLDLGLPQTIEVASKAQIEEIIENAKVYVEKVANDDFLSKALPLCKNMHKSCAFWASLGEVSYYFLKRNRCRSVTVGTHFIGSLFGDCTDSVRRTPPT